MPTKSVMLLPKKALLVITTSSTSIGKSRSSLSMYFGPDLCPAGRQQFRARQDYDDVTLANDRVWLDLDDLVIPADPGDE